MQYAVETRRRESYLIAARTRPEALVGKIQLLDAERARLLLIVVDELILETSRHNGGGGGEVTREAAAKRRVVVENAPELRASGGESSFAIIYAWRRARRWVRWWKWKWRGEGRQ